MNAIDYACNRLPCHTDWHRYDSPTVLRRHGRGFLEKSWKNGHAPLPTIDLATFDLNQLAESYGGQCIATVDYQLLIFDDYHWARRCDQQLIKLGLTTLRWGCHIQVHEAP
jgi:hypothetical protein